MNNVKIEQLPSGALLITVPKRAAKAEPITRIFPDKSVAIYGIEKAIKEV